MPNGLLSYSRGDNIHNVAQNCYFRTRTWLFDVYSVSGGADENKSWIRHRREIEDLSEEFPPPVKAQEEPGFWERVMNVAIRIFNKFIEWLNTS
ncbi:unnamed protein product [Pieris macdunnoughi]|uniref:Uncharacterized protein n=1 Tax=Pieris macdunnoughi TaxID=345717 RepID=A0A821MXM7_9NEOP|nr:unnamed protein product [Pieris macdunnoughi]